MKKLLLLLVLFLGGCSLNKTPSSALVDLIGSKAGVYVHSLSPTIFYISNDATEYSVTSEGIYLDYNDGSDNSAIYKGFEDTGDVEYYITITLYDITHAGGKISKEGYNDFSTTFEWIH